MLELNNEGYNLIDAGEGTWYLQVVGDTAFRGTFREVYMFSLYRIGFKADDLDEAILDLAKSGNNTAHFGMMKRFIYSYNKTIGITREVA